MKARITISMSDDGEFEIRVNEAGRDQLIEELRRLSLTNDHFHLGPEDMAEVELSSRRYRDTDVLVDWGKISFRPDEWDAQYFPHVLTPSA